ncbi:UBX domain-containing protein 1-like isoform X2 [Durio zibethinus]|uniref:UBX domain-containing protein 1-like isoform X2 n=1 Tax=Durio zibethinus TaxID=66656 RepID=A0A6P6A1T4_DURZI|nr:UBX domain-containing protein 1-like isoform X2 [Durio zibethinus]
MQPQQEIPVMVVKMKSLEELEPLGFPRDRAVRALHYSGNTTIKAAVNWLIDHENDAEIDQMPLVALNMDIESPQPSDITEAIQIKEQELSCSLLGTEFAKRKKKKKRKVKVKGRRKEFGQVKNCLKQRELQRKMNDNAF